MALEALGNANEVINKDIHMCIGPSVFHQRDMIFGLQQRRCELCKLRDRGSRLQGMVLRLWQW